MLRAPPGVCVPAQISILPSANCAVAFIGSICAWFRNGYAYAASTTLRRRLERRFDVAVRRAWPTPEASGASSAAFLSNAAVLSAAALLSFHVTFSCWRALSRQPPRVGDDGHAADEAAQACRLPPSTTNACFTPGSVLM